MNIVLSFIFVTLFWVVFHADSFSTVWKVCTRMFTAHTGMSQPYTWSIVVIICLLIGRVAAVIHSRMPGLKIKNGETGVNGFYLVMQLTKFLSLVVFFTFCGFAIIFGYYSNTSSIYGAF